MSYSHDKHALIPFYPIKSIHYLSICIIFFSFANPFFIFGRFDIIYLLQIVFFFAQASTLSGMAYGID